MARGLLCCKRQCGSPSATCRRVGGVLVLADVAKRYERPHCNPSALSELVRKSRGLPGQVRATVAFRQRHFVASGTDRIILTVIMYYDTITPLYLRRQTG